MSDEVDRNVGVHGCSAVLQRGTGATCALVLVGQQAQCAAAGVCPAHAAPRLGASGRAF